MRRVERGEEQEYDMNNNYQQDGYGKREGEREGERGREREREN